MAEGKERSKENRPRDAAASQGTPGAPIAGDAAVLHGADAKRLADIKAEEAGQRWRREAEARGEIPVEIGGPKGLEPTRYGDWEKAGRCIDF